jgi:hypothetical protein
MSLLKSVLRAIFGGKGRGGDYRINRWRDSETRDITRPRDPRTKFCVANIGTPVTIKYKGKRRTITPLRVFTKPQFHKSYVLAKDGFARKTFDIDDITLVRKKK